MERILKVTEAAERIGVSPQILRLLERRGVFKAARDYQGKRIFTQEDVEAIRKKIFPNGVKAEI